jgi:hypothetical protein
VLSLIHALRNSLQHTLSLVSLLCLHRLSGNSFPHCSSFSFHVPRWEDGSVIYSCCWSSPAQLFTGPSPSPHDHILLSQIWDAPNLEGQVPVFISPRNKVAQLHLQALGSLSITSCYPQAYSGDIQTSQGVEWYSLWADPTENTASNSSSNVGWGLYPCRPHRKHCSQWYSHWLLCMAYFIVASLFIEP